MKKRHSLLVWGAVLTAVLLAIDQLTKYCAKTYLAPVGSVSVIPGVFEFFYLENRGAAFGMLADQKGFFILVAALMCAAAAYIYIRLPEAHHYTLMRVICILVVAGAAGNMIDRMLHAFVIDFLYVSLIDFPVFNIADCYVCIGAALAIVSIFTVYRKEEFEFLFPRKNAHTEKDR
ncbi:MAG: signal peptidase II [Lachnospiraceae bacterium]